MFSITYVILPFSLEDPADAIRESLAPFQRAGCGDLPDNRLTFADETASVELSHEALFTFIRKGTGGLQIEGNLEAWWNLDDKKIRDEMHRRGLLEWQVRFADIMGLGEFFACFCHQLERHPETGRYGRWRNALGKWDWWDLGGRFDGRILGDQDRAGKRRSTRISSGPNNGRMILANVEDQIGAALGQAPFVAADVRADRNIELAATLLNDVRAGRDHACPGSFVLPPGSVEQRLRWVDTWPELGPMDAVAWLGAASEASWERIVEAAYLRFEDHWVAGVAYHH